MLYALIALGATNIGLLGLVGYVVARGLQAHNQTLALLDARDRAKDDNHREHVQHLEDQIVLLKVEPPVAVAKAVGAPDTPKQFTVYDSDDEFHAAMAELD